MLNLINRETLFHCIREFIYMHFRIYKLNQNNIIFMYFAQASNFERIEQMCLKHKCINKSKHVNILISIIGKLIKITFKDELYLNLY